MKNIQLFLIASASSIALSNAAWAHDDAPGMQVSPNEEQATPDQAPTKEIVVTGTLIRGTAPGGAQTISLGQDAIAATGANTTSDLLKSVPQAGNFVSFVGVKGSSNFSLSVNRPSLRYLGNSSSSSNSTLMLVDGHRLPGMGVLQTTPDLDAIAPGAIERVEIVTDGGSATYGSDAVGGVINFITRKSYDGIETKASYGLGDNYRTANASVLAGKAWDGGSAYLSYDYSWHDGLLGADRNWSRNLDWINTNATGSPVGADNQCAVPNIQIGGGTYAYPSLTRGLGNRCDNSKLQTLYPSETKHALFGSLVLDSGGPVQFSVKAFYVHRTDLSDGGPFSASLALPASSPYYVVIPGTAGTETVLTNFSSALGDHSPQRTTMDSFGITPTIKIALGNQWELNTVLNYGYGKATFMGNLLNTSPIVSAITAGTFDPLHLGAATNAAALATATDWYNYGFGTDQIINERLVVDGPLFKLPAGDLRAAIGAEYLYEDYSGNNSRGLTAAGIASLPARDASRTVTSLFGELNVPLLGQDVGLFHSLSLTLSGRYDRYSDFGHTFNPKVGMNFEPVDWLRIRGNWGKAFQAPGLSDIALAGANSLNVIPLSVRNYVDPNTPAGTTLNNTLVILGGTVSPLQPQKAKTWSLGFDMKPPVVPGLALGMTYYNIAFNGQIAIPPIFTPSVFYAQFPNNYVLYTQGNAAMQTYLNQLTSLANNPQVLSGLPNGINSVYAVIDDRSLNLKDIKTSGLDFYARYRHETRFGAVFADVSGTYILTFKTFAFAGAPAIDSAAHDTTRMRLSTTVGTDVGRFRAQVTWNHASGFATTPTAANLQQDHVGAYDLFDAFLRYEVPAGSALLKDVTLTLNVDNIFDKDPPVYHGSFSGIGATSVGYANGFTLGRVFKLGVSKKF